MAMTVWNVILFPSAKVCLMALIFFIKAFSGLSTSTGALSGISLIANELFEADTAISGFFYCFFGVLLELFHKQKPMAIPDAIAVKLINCWVVLSSWIFFFIEANIIKSQQIKKSTILKKYLERYKSSSNINSFTRKRYKYNINYLQMNNYQEKGIYFTPIQAHPKWQKQIVPILINLVNEKYDQYKVISILKEFNEKYCWRRKQFGQFKSKKINNYQALYSLYKSNLVGLLKVFANALLQIKPEPIKMVMGQETSHYSYKKQEIVYILLLMFFSLTPKLFSDGRGELENRFHNKNNLSYILSHHEFKTKCVVQYLKMAVSELINCSINKEVFSIVRNVQRKKLQEILFTSKGGKMGKYEILGNDRSIEEFNGQLKVDFANRFIGGGCLREGCVQQQIMFAVRPELYATTLLCQKMDHNEALGLIGFKRYFQYKGYGKTTQYVGKANINYSVSQNLQTKQFIVAMDALKYSKQGFQQFQQEEVNREILKAYVGFGCLKEEGKIVSGGWGCGVYNGDFQLKFLIQWISASLANRQLLICPFGRKKILEQNNLLEKIKNYAITEIYDLTLRASQMKLSKKYERQSIFNLISMELNNGK